ncbi:hypothetical protein [Nocardioides jensenii]|uniref:hypothetical protein n=1 Tax=Nocardioides jensenii TaxID=1843 RepID=UPI0008302F01|nr:hypothetical protein [Nocardioides jensenii]
MPTHAAAFTAAIATRDREKLADLFVADVDFRALTPGRQWEAHTPEEVTAIILDHWFEEQDRVIAVHLLEAATIVDTERMGYRFELETPDGSHLVEQQAYYRTDGDRFTWVRVLCSGFRPVATA